VPHSPQKLSSGWIGAPQFGQAAMRGVPQLVQNLRPSRLSLPHFEQRILPHSGCDGFVRSRLCRLLVHTSDTAVIYAPDLSSIDQQTISYISARSSWSGRGADFRARHQLVPLPVAELTLHPQQTNTPATSAPEGQHNKASNRKTRVLGDPVPSGRDY
jgi:hypothetical protein